MSTIQRRNSQRLASALEGLTSDLDITAAEVEADENISAADLSPSEYLKQDGRDYGDNGQDSATQYLGGDDRDEDNEDFKAAIAQLENDCEDGKCAFDDDACPQCGNQPCTCQGGDDGDVEEASIEQGDPGVDDFGSEETFDTDNVRSLGSGYGIDFDGDEDLQDSIRNVPGKQARIKKLIARIENVANHLERTGRKKLAYRLDIVCNNLEQKYQIKK